MGPRLPAPPPGAGGAGGGRTGRHAFLGLCAWAAGRAAAQDPPGAEADDYPGVPHALWDLLADAWPVNAAIAALGALALYLFIQAILQTRRRRAVPRLLAQATMDDMASGRYEAAQQRLEGHPCLFSATLLPGLRMHQHGMDRIRRATESAGRRAVGRLRRRYGHMAGIATAIFLLGLLGTVLGMAEAFRLMHADIPQGFRALGLASSVGRAMATTLAGLATALPLLALHQYARHRVDRAADMLEEAVEEALRGLEETRKG